MTRSLGFEARRVAAVVLAALVVTLAVWAPPAVAAPARINGSGSSYVALAMQQWVADAQTSGLQVNYLPTGSPQGLTSFGQSLSDFAGTEAEFSALSARGGEETRGYQYVPDVAGAIAAMYNVQDGAGRKVDYLHLSRRTIARIFTGDISRWSDPAISADNKGLVLPDQPITVVYRGGQSGTTGLFYDFVASVAPDIFGPWAARNQLPTNVRIIQLDSAPNFAPKTQAFSGSDQIAQHVASAGGLWSIGYDEFGYAKTYKVSTAWVENASGNWVLPYAQNISSALEGATLRPDLSQELSGVYNSPKPDAYPISAYSYLVTQCTQSGDRPTCKGPYDNEGVTETLVKWMRYIACEGQVNMAQIGYSPLPPNLSQEIANSIGRMQGTAPEVLTPGNCKNPRFAGPIGGPAPPADPLKNATSLAPKAGTGPAAGPAASDAPGKGQKQATRSAGAAGPATGPAATETGPGTTEVAATEEVAAGRPGAVAALGGSSDWRSPQPVAYDRPGVAASGLLPVVLLFALIVVPPIVFGRLRRAGGPPGEG